MKLKHIFFKYCFKYFVGFLIVLLACVPIVVASRGIIERKVLESSHLKLQEGINEIDQNISKMQLIDSIVSGSTYFNRLMHTNGSMYYGEYMNLAYARNQLSELNYIYTFSPYFFVLFQDNDFFVSSSQCSETFSTDYYSLFLSVSGQGGEELEPQTFKENLFLMSSPYMKLDSISYFYNGTSRTLSEPILYSPTHPVYSFQQSGDYRLVFVLDSDSLLRLLLTEESIQSGFARLTDADGTVLYDYGEEVSLLDSDASSSLVRGVSDSYYLLSYQAEESGLHITIGYPQSIITGEVSLLMKLIVLYVFLGLLVVLILTLFFSYHHYSSVKKLFVAVPEDKRSLAYQSHNEYDTLGRVFHEISQNMDTYKTQLTILDKQNQAIMLENLIVRGITTKEERERFEKCFPKPLDFFCVVLLKMNVLNQEDYQPALLCIVEYLKENYPNDFVNVRTGLMDELFLLSLNPSDSSNVQGIQKMFQTIVYALSDDMGATFHIGISAIGTDIANVNACYNQARQVTQAFIHQPKNIIEIYTIDMNAVHENVVNPEFLNKLYNLLLSGEQEGIGNLFNRLVTYYQKMPMQYEAQKQQIFYSIRNVIYSAGLHLPSEAPGEDFLPKYQVNDSIRLMANRLQQAAFQTCVLMTRGHVDKKEEVKDRVTQYMEEHYADVSLSIAHVCRQMNISEKYLQQMMKERTGETFAASLERIRISHAAEYLLSTSWSNEKIAEATGFAAVSTFYRVFNKVMGMSPGSYRTSRSTAPKSAPPKT